MAPNPSFLPPSQISSAGGNGSPQSGSGRVQTQDPPQSRPFPWPLPYSATQGAVGGAGGKGMVAVQPTPYSQPYFGGTWPYQLPQLGWLPNSTTVRT